MQVGSIVQLIDNPQAGTARVIEMAKSTGLVELDQPLNGFRIWARNQLQITDAESVHLGDFNNRLYHLMRREDGSIYLYWTQDGDPAQYILWDSLDV